MGAVEYLQSLKDQYRTFYVLNVNGRHLSKELLDEYFDLKAKMGRLYNVSSTTHPEMFFNRIIQESRPWLAKTMHN